ncbi:hypothetical protein I7I50_00069 [Histoplasma capsulatum G186AR]|uniref:Uncharacterized protein n=1 Tax=Ajellomyces capsulatus TaxID=5037 RepID=A0A8H8CUM4_AJECA|nr:hypothetical protein I7I52_07338 [Histoplasma capsulatum]QSS72271.1 hypothetical protein I7I50_00069 [Histoplasma capsulatum G186AR]
MASIPSRALSPSQLTATDGAGQQGICSTSLIYGGSNSVFSLLRSIVCGYCTIAIFKGDKDYASPWKKLVQVPTLLLELKRRLIHRRAILHRFSGTMTAQSINLRIFPTKQAGIANYTGSLEDCRRRPLGT